MNPLEKINTLEWASRIRHDVLKMAFDVNTASAAPLILAPEIFSVIEILCILYLEIMRHRPDHPAWPDRDRFILAKPLAWPAHISLLRNLGYLPARLNGTAALSRLPDMSDTPGVDFSAGHGGAVCLSVAVGMCLGLRQAGRQSSVYVLLGGPDVESSETWRAAARATETRTSRMCVVVENCEGIEHGKIIAERFRAFGWDSVVMDGHSLEELRYGFSKFRKSTTGRPMAIVAQTRRGRGSKILEESAGEPTVEELGAAITELDALSEKSSGD